MVGKGDDAVKEMVGSRYDRGGQDRITLPDVVPFEEWSKGSGAGTLDARTLGLEARYLSRYQLLRTWSRIVRR